MGFFDFHPEFLVSSQVGVALNRLNARYQALIASNIEAIKGKRILDLGSHDGRWSFTALEAGASYVHGIEARQYLVDNAYANLKNNSIPEDKFSFQCDRVQLAMQKLASGEFDTVFCFGIFYHVSEHASILREARRLTRKWLLIDTAVFVSDEPVTWIGVENSTREANGVGENLEGNEIIGIPSKKALETYLSHFNFTWRIHEWHAREHEKGNWDFIEDYFY